VLSIAGLIGGPSTPDSSAAYFLGAVSTLDVFSCPSPAFRLDLRMKKRARRSTKLTAATTPITIPAIAPPLRELLLLFGKVVALEAGMLAIVDEGIVVDIIDMLDAVLVIDIDIDIEDMEDIADPPDSTELPAIMLRPVSSVMYSPKTEEPFLQLSCGAGAALVWNMRTAH
jgi:hypothetical protein